MHVGERIREIRLANQMSQQELANAIGCSRPAVVLWENASRRIPLEKLRRVAKALRSPISALLVEPGQSIEQSLEPAERELVALYRQLPEPMRRKYLELFEISATTERKPRNPPLKLTQSRRVADARLIDHPA